MSGDLPPDAPTGLYLDHKCDDIEWMALGQASQRGSSATRTIQFGEAL